MASYGQSGNMLGRTSSRLIIGNALEWGLQPLRKGMPGNHSATGSRPYPDDDMTYFFSGDSKVVVTRHQPDAAYIADASAILGYAKTTCTNLDSAISGPLICAEIARNAKALAQLLDLIGELPPGPVLSEAYAATPEYADLIDVLQADGSRPVHDAMTSRNRLGVLARLDSKVSVREFFAAAVSGLSPVRLTRAFTAASADDLEDTVVAALGVLGPLMLKMDYGSGGHGMSVMYDPASVSEKISGFLPPGYTSEVLIEEFIGSGADVTPLCYTGVVEPDGTVGNSSVGRELQYGGNLYAGARIGAESMPDDVAESTLQAGQAVGGAISCFGFRGAFTLDFLWRPRDGSVFLLEINPRRALPSMLSDICAQVYGAERYQSVAATALRWVPVHPSLSRYEKLRDFLVARNLFGLDSGLLVLPYMVSQLPTDSVIGLAVAGTGPDDVTLAADEAVARLSGGT
jgi:hypothetical protein